MLQFKRSFLTVGLTLVAAVTGLAQTQTLEGIKSMSRSAITPIYAGHEVKGYLMYGQADKADRKNDNYHLDFYDQDLGKVSTVTIQKPAGKYYLLDNAFNGSAFALYYFNQKDKTLEIETYDTGLKKLASKAVSTDISKMEMSGIGQKMNTNNAGGEGAQLFSGLDLRPVEGQGFVRSSADGRRYLLEMYDNNLNLKWRQQTDAKAKMLEMLVVTEVTGNYLMGTMMRRPSLLSQQLSSYIVAFDLSTGKKVLDQPVESSKTEQLSLSSVGYDAARKEFVAVGEYYKLTDKPFVNKSQGFYIKRFDDKGKLLGIRPYNWQKEVKGLLPAEARKAMDEGFINYTHSIQKGADGSLYLVAEQYRIGGKGMDVALAVLGGGGGGAKGIIGNMLVFVLDPEYKLTAIKCFVKDESKMALPPGAGFMGAGLTGQFIKAYGGFDYQFTQQTAANSQFNVVYINFDKEKGEATKKVVGNILFGTTDQFKVDKIDGNSAATYSYVYPAKPGYVMLVDYLKKQKQMGMKLVKLNM
ncbi:DUF6770 family protein [Hymenobacter lapidiphilus]|uniref:Uncharacterized protein n=1 Tax=Hymenobacter lapidiphilus TaxID=2608003 RepID=A0A7Y7PRU4_9BACT|nr:DUF6770 family protein [Hymenobacter lapidiphilus]NVO32889.1 hypothetical protein [Hymenobacter lapidiphilus]